VESIVVIVVHSVVDVVHSVVDVVHAVEEIFYLTAIHYVDLTNVAGEIPTACTTAKIIT